MTLFYVSIFFLIVIVIGVVIAELQVKRSRQQGIYPEKGKTTMEDVTRLLSIGEETLALRAYREIHGVSLKKAKKEIKKLSSNC